MEEYRIKQCKRKQEDAQQYATAQINLALERLETVRASLPTQKQLQRAEKKYSDAVKYHQALQDWRMEIAETNLAHWRKKRQMHSYQTSYNKEIKEKFKKPKEQLLRMQKVGILFEPEKEDKIRLSTLKKLEPIHEFKRQLDADYKNKMEQFREEEQEILEQKIPFQQYRTAREEE